MQLPHSRPIYPELGSGEQAIAEVTLGTEIAVLTQRRLVVAGPGGEQSTPLTHVALVRVRYERIPRSIIAGAVFIAVAIALFAVTSPIRTFFLNQSVAVEAGRQEQQSAPGENGGGLARTLQRIFTGVAGAAGGLPLVAWLLVAVGAARVGLGLLGQTVVTIFAGGGEFKLTRLGRNRALEGFVKEVGRHLPATERA